MKLQEYKKIIDNLQNELSSLQGEKIYEMASIFAGLSWQIKNALWKPHLRCEARKLALHSKKLADKFFRM